MSHRRKEYKSSPTAGPTAEARGRIFAVGRDHQGSVFNPAWNKTENGE
jgi:hypothetical protein